MISKLACSLRGQTQTVRIVPGTLAAAAYGGESATEQFLCNYGVNPEYRDALIRDPIRASGIDDDGAVRIVELPSHHFYLVTLFVPQLNSSEQTPHPLIQAFFQKSADHSRA